LWWVDLGQLPDPHPAALSLSRTGGENTMRKVMGGDKGRETTHQLLSWARLDSR